MDTVDLTLSNGDLWRILVGFLMPLVIAAINQRTWRSQIKAAVMFGASVVVAAITLFFQGGVDWTDYPRAFLLIFTTAQLGYLAWWKPSGVTDAIETATSNKEA